MNSTDQCYNFNIAGDTGMACVCYMKSVRKVTGILRGLRKDGNARTYGEAECAYGGRTDKLLLYEKRFGPAATKRRHKLVYMQKAAQKWRKT